MSLSPVRKHGPLFIDHCGGQMMLRGVNLGGDSKTPFPDGGTQFPSDFSNHKAVSFVGRPFPLDEAREHLERIAYWGFNTLRLLTSWEAVEHAGPGLHDQDYLDYLSDVVSLAGRHGLYVLIDFHQDAWSRMSGGDGAPGWTFEAVGLDFTKFDAADAAHVMQARFDYSSPEAHQAAYPPMSWGSNYRLPANAIMWSLFWGGRLFAPQFKIGDENVQDFLQSHYLGAMSALACRLASAPNVLGFDTLNEPGLGWTGAALSYRHVVASQDHPDEPRVGPALSPLDGLAMARGLPVTVPLLTRDSSGKAVPTSERTFNSNRVSIWKADSNCPFEAAGAYRVENGVAIALDEDHFRFADGRRLTMPVDGFAPFFRRVAETVGAHCPDWSIFAEMDPFAHVSGRRFPAGMPNQSVNACHWYDIGMLYLKKFDPEDHWDAVSGNREHSLKMVGVRYREQLSELASEAAAFPGGGAPTFIGEFGIPYDLNDGEAFRRWSAGERQAVWDRHEQALSLMYDALDALGLHSTQWNYTVSNRNDPRIGDDWNQEDLSIFSKDQQDEADDPDSGGRAIAGFCRPYVRRVQGRLTSVKFDSGNRSFVAEYQADAEVEGATELYVPKLHYGSGFAIRVEGVPALVDIVGDQHVSVRACASGQAFLIIEPAGARAWSRE